MFPRKCSVLQDEKLIAKLSVGDVVAQELDYLLTCRKALYNRERAVPNQQKPKEDLTKSVTETKVDDLVLAELGLVTHITETQITARRICFKLCHLYHKSRLRQFGESAISVNTTRLSDKIFNKNSRAASLQ